SRSYGRTRRAPRINASAAKPISQGLLAASRQGMVARGENPMAVSGEQPVATMPRHTVDLPAIGHLVRNAATHLLEATIAPLVLFYGIFSGAGMRWALMASLAWSYGAIALRMIRRQRVPGILLMGA